MKSLVSSKMILFCGSNTNCRLHSRHLWFWSPCLLKPLRTKPREPHEGQQVRIRLTNFKVGQTAYKLTKNYPNPNCTAINLDHHHQEAGARLEDRQNRKRTSETNH